MPYLSTCTTALSVIPPHLCKCVLFHCCVSLHKNTTTSWVKQMFYCRAQQLLKWLASIWVPLLQLAATAEPEQSISMRRVDLEWEKWRMERVLLYRIWQQAALLLFPMGSWHNAVGKKVETLGQKALTYQTSLTHNDKEVMLPANKEVGLPTSPCS